MKKILLLFLVLFTNIQLANATINNPYGIFYAPVFKDGQYYIQILNIAKHSVAKKAGITANSRIKAINDDQSLTMKNLKTYFEAKKLSIVLIDTNNSTKTLELLARSERAIEISKKQEAKIDKLIHLSRYKEALSNINRYVKKYPYDVTLKSLKVDILLYNKLYGEAINELNGIYKLTNSPQSLGAIASIYITMGNYNTAKKYALKALELNPKEINANAVMFICSTDEQNYDDAFKYADKLVTLDPKAYTSYLYRGIAYKNLNNYSSALSDLNRSYALANKTTGAFIPTVAQQLIIVNEQIILNTVAGVKQFVDLPSWLDICPSEYILGTGKKAKWNDYWTKRREVFYRNVNNCISDYSGNELYKCYASVKSKELIANEDYKIEREHVWGQEKREEIFCYARTLTGDILKGLYFIKTAPQTINVNYSGSLNQRIDFTGTMYNYNRYYFN